MTDTWVRGGVIAGTAQSDLYTAGNSSIVDVSICNAGTAGTVSVDLTHSPLGTADATAHYILSGFQIAAGDAWFTPFPLKMIATDKLRCKSNTATVVSFRYFGIEVS